MNTFTNDAECDEAVHGAGPNVQSERMNPLYNMPMEMQVSISWLKYILYETKRQ